MPIVYPPGGIMNVKAVLPFGSIAAKEERARLSCSWHLVIARLLGQIYASGSGSANDSTRSKSPPSLL